MYKAPLTAAVFNNFSSSFQHLSPTFVSSPFVYVDTDGVRFLTSLVELEKHEGLDEVFALSVAEDGFVEMLAFS